jgi:outer membrane protein TolC
VHQFLSLTLASIILLGASSQESILSDKDFKLTPKLIIAKLLSSSASVKAIKIRGKSAEIPVLLANSQYDGILSFSSTFGHNRGENLSGMAPETEKTKSYSAQYLKKFSSGTELSIAGRNTSVDADYAPGMFKIGMPRGRMNTLDVRVGQDLWNNYFGEASRATLRSAEQGRQAAQIQAKRDVSELVYRVLGIYWQALENHHVIKSMRETEKKIIQLRVYVKKRARFGLDEIGEIERIEADQNRQQQRIALTNLHLDELIVRIGILLNLKIPQNIESIFPTLDDGTVRPKVVEFDIHNDQRIIAARKELDSKKSQYEAEISKSKPKLQAFIQNSAIGVDSDSEASREEMLEGGKSNFLIGLHLSTPINNTAARSAVATRLTEFKLAEINLSKKMDQIRGDQLVLSKKAQLAWDFKNRAQQTLKLRQAALKLLERGYRQGRVRLDQIIMAQNMRLESSIQLIQSRVELLKSKDSLRLHQGRLIDHYAVRRDSSE